MAIFEFNANQWYQGMWRAEIHNGDFLAFMWLENGTWYFRYRLRYYHDHKTWDSDDEKRSYGFYRLDAPGVKERMFAIVQETLGSMTKVGGLRQLEYFPCGGTEVEMMNILEKVTNGIHIKTLTEEEAIQKGYVAPKKKKKAKQPK